MTQAEQRIASLDIVRGVAVMGILAMNIVAFGMPMAAYMNPRAYGWEGAADFIVYAFNFVAVDGKMRGLFSFLFGASLLLVAEKAGDRARSVTFRRLFWLLLFGLAHFYLIWFGDILVGYALIGFLAFAFRRRSPKWLVIWAVLLIILQFLFFAGSTVWAYGLQSQLAAGGGADIQAQWDALSRDVGVPSAARLAETLALYRGSYAGILDHQLNDKAAYPFVMTLTYLAETLGYMLLGMAALKTGLLTGAWDDRRYWRWAGIGLAVSLPAMLFFLSRLVAEDFSVPAVFAWTFTAPTLVRPAMFVAYACLIILATRRGGRLVERIAATGQMAFTNYLGTSILMTGLFYGWGLGLFGHLSRWELYLPVLAMWALMLAWSKPWLERYRYGPLEWAWRSLTNLRAEPMRRAPAVAAPV